MPINNSLGKVTCHKKIKIQEPRILYVIKGFLIVGFSSPIGKILDPIKKLFYICNIIYNTMYII